MREYPHKRYLVYLVTKKMTQSEVSDECSRLGLPVPAHEDLIEIKADLGKFPRSWDFNYDRKNEYFCRWLRSKKVLEIWRDSKTLKEVRLFLYKSAIRKDFETLFVAHKDIDVCREQLLLKYEERSVPETGVLDKFRSYFWDILSMSPEGLFDFLRDSQERAVQVSAVSGDIASAYAQMGLTHQISAEKFYNGLIALADHQIQEARKNIGLLSGSSLMGVAALSRQALEAIKERDELLSENRIEVLDAIRDQVSAFRTRIINVPDIITLEELEGEKENVKLTIVSD